MITKDEFDRYERIRRIGLVNMWDIRKVMQLTGLNRVQVLTIMKQYATIRDEYYAPIPEPAPDTVTCFKCQGEFPADEVLPYDRLTGDAICFACIDARNRRAGWGRGE